METRPSADGETDEASRRSGGASLAGAADASSLGLLELTELSPSETASLGRLKSGFVASRESNGRIRYTNTETGEIVYDKPFDRCGTFGCILEVRFTCITSHKCFTLII